MVKPALLRQLRLPASPMFIASGAKLVVAQCKAGIVGSFPALDARPAEEFKRWITRIEHRGRAGTARRRASGFMR